MPKGISLKSSDLDRSLTSNTTRNLGLVPGSDSASAASITSLNRNASKSSMSSFKRFDMRSSSSLASQHSLPTRTGMMGNATWDDTPLKETKSKASLTSLKSNPFLDGTYSKIERDSSRKSSISSFKRSDMRSSSSLASQHSLPTCIGMMGNAAWDDTHLKETESKASLTSQSSNPFLDGTYSKVQRRNSSSSASVKDDNQLKLSMVGELEATAKLISGQLQDDHEDVAPETSSGSDDNTEDPFEETIVVDTFREKIPQQLDRSLLTSADLANLKETDAFMYYSIPAVKQARWEGRAVDFDVELSEPVERRSAISFEKLDVDIPAYVEEMLSEEDSSVAFQ